MINVTSPEHSLSNSARGAFARFFGIGTRAGRSLLCLASALLLLILSPAYAQAASSTFGATGADPTSITIDAAGNLFTANSGSDSISRISRTGVSTVNFANTGFGPYGIVAAPDGYVYTANAWSDNISRIGPNGSSIVWAATGSAPIAITIDPYGTLYTANQGDDSVTRVPISGPRTQIFLPSGSGPAAIVSDSSGNIYTANTTSDTVSRITSGGVVTTFASTGGEPGAMAIDAAGYVYTANAASGSVTKISPAGVASTLASGLGVVTAVALDRLGNVYVASASEDLVRMIPQGGGAPIIVGSTGTNPSSMVLNANGDIFVANLISATVTRIDSLFPLPPTPVQLSVRQELPLPTSGLCADVADADYSWGTGVYGGWTKTWAPWPRAGQGGWACLRVLVNRGGNNWDVQNG